MKGVRFRLGVGAKMGLAIELVPGKQTMEIGILVVFDFLQLCRILAILEHHLALLVVRRPGGEVEDRFMALAQTIKAIDQSVNVGIGMEAERGTVTAHRDIYVVQELALVGLTDFGYCYLR